MITIQKQIIPTYIKEFTRESKECILVHKKNSPRNLSNEEFQEEWSFSSQLTPCLNLNNLSIESEVDLTGNPLQVDLDGSVMSTFLTSTVVEVPPNWTIAESQHFPLCLSEARDFLNKKYNCKVSLIPTYCVTDGKDNKKTVILGSHYSDDVKRIFMGHFMGMYKWNDDELSLERLHKEHDKYVRVKADSTEYNFRRIYNVHGFALQWDMPALEYSKCNGHMILETSWSKFCREEPGIEEFVMKMILKVVSGHEHSAVRFLWDQLGTIKKFLKILSDPEAVNDGNTVVSDDYLTVSTLTENLQNLCHQRLRKKPKIDGERLDWNQLREDTVLDKLWFLLNKCQNLTDLKNSFSMFFSIAKFEKFYLGDSILAPIVQYCLETSDFAAKLSFAESLKLLVYIGFEKMKLDYFTICNFYHPMHQAILEKQWSEFQVKDQQISRRVTGIVKNSKFTDTFFNKNKMEFLMKLHDTSEILAFLQKNDKICSNMSSDNLSLICKHIYQKYIFNDIENPRCDDLNVKLLDITCTLNSGNNQLYDDKIPVTSLFEMTSKVHDSTITTIFHISQHPIFPKCIFDNYEVELEELEFRKSLYVSKFVILK